MFKLELILRVVLIAALAWLCWLDLGTVSLGSFRLRPDLLQQHPVRLFVISLTAATVGIQLAAAGFLASVFELQREKAHE